MEIEVDKVCRLCLKESEPLEPINCFQIEQTPVLEVMKLVLYCLELDSPIFEDEKESFPNKICRECVEILRSSFKLNKICSSNQAVLKALIGCEDTVIEEIYEEIQEIKIEEDYDEEVVDQNSDEIIETTYKALEASPDNSKLKKVAEKKHICRICNKAFEKPSKLTRHIGTHDIKKRPYACEVAGCFQRFMSDASLKRHAILHSGMTIKVQEEKTFECMICAKTFHVQEALASHIRTHKDVMESMEFSCNLCDKVFKKLNELTRHRRKHPENKSHKCLICSKMFSQGSHLIDHLNRHKNLRPHTCHICNKAFQQSSTLKDHLRTHTTEKPFLCSQCGKSFNNPSNLRQHVKRHLNLKEFACHLCPGKYSCKASLDSHILSHSGIKPHSCSFCGSSFTKGSSLKKHVRTIHEGIKPFQCEACSMKFNSSEHLKRHTRTHTGEKPYKCDFEECTRAYAQSNDLLKHKKIHVGELVYKCTICTEAFRLQSQLREHYRIHYESKEDNE